MIQINQEPGETCEKYPKRAERLALAHHDLHEAYKVQFIANGLIHNLRTASLPKNPKLSKP